MVRMVTLKQLQDNGACASSQDDFSRMFGEEAPATVESLLSMGEGAQSWVMDKLFTEEQRRKFAQTSFPRHDGFDAGPRCRGCMARAERLVELYNEDEENVDDNIAKNADNADANGGSAEVL